VLHVLREVDGGGARGNRTGLRPRSVDASKMRSAD
jgi:hypothetical protein